jgi:hypothetical protein
MAEDQTQEQQLSGAQSSPKHHCCLVLTAFGTGWFQSWEPPCVKGWHPHCTITQGQQACGHAALRRGSRLRGLGNAACTDGVIHWVLTEVALNRQLPQGMQCSARAGCGGEENCWSRVGLLSCSGQCLAVPTSSMAEP